MVNENLRRSSHVDIKVFRINMVSPSSIIYRRNTNSFTMKSIEGLLLRAVSNSRLAENIHVNKIVLNLGVIPALQFSVLFNQRLAQALIKCLAQLATHADTRNTASADTTPAELLMSVESNSETLTPLAICCLQQATVRQLLQNGQPQYLRLLLKRLLQGEDRHSSALADTCYSRVTANRLGIAALNYLLNQVQGHAWLSQHAPTADQVTNWATAIAQGEIPPEQVAQLLTGNRSSDGILMIGQPAYRSLIVMRWLLPLWRQPSVRKVIHRLTGGLGVQRLDAYLSRCLQRQDNVMQEEQGEPADHYQVALLRDNTTLPEREEEHTARDHATLPQSEKMPATARNAMQPGKSGFRSPNEPRSSSQGIRNAGLLLLWPLLPQLFSQLGLWEEERFVSDAARWQAVYGLDRLVWGDVGPTEGRLTLNQVLCGVSCSTSVPPSMPLSLLQLQQIDDWLAAIGQQLPGWQKLSLTDIRQLFLQRAGEISTQRPVPQINVWPEPYDFLLRDWPWPMTLASFPWTEQPLTIVWPLNGFTG